MSARQGGSATRSHGRTRVRVDGPPLVPDVNVVQNCQERRACVAGAHFSARAVRVAAAASPPTASLMEEAQGGEVADAVVGRPAPAKTHQAVREGVGVSMWTWASRAPRTRTGSAAVEGLTASRPARACTAPCRRPGGSWHVCNTIKHAYALPRHMALPSPRALSRLGPTLPSMRA